MFLRSIGANSVVAEVTGNEPDREEVADGRLRRYYRLTDEGAALLAAETERRRATAAVAAQRLRARLAGGTA